MTYITLECPQSLIRLVRSLIDEWQEFVVFFLIIFV